MKQPVYFPFYNIHSDLVKSALGVKDSRSVEKRLVEAGIKIKEIGSMKCVTCEDLLNVTENRTVFVNYEPKSVLSKSIDSLK